MADERKLIALRAIWFAAPKGVKDTMRKKKVIEKGAEFSAAPADAEKLIARGMAAVAVAKQVTVADDPKKPAE